MKKNLLSFLKKENVGFVIVVLVMILGLGCGKDDKAVTSVTPPNYFDFGTDSKYLNAVPLGLNVEDTTAINVIRWNVPTGFAADTTLTAYRIDVSSAVSFGSFFSPGRDFVISDTSNVTVGRTYTYTVTSIFTLLDTTYNFYFQVESMPSAPFIVIR